MLTILMASCEQRAFVVSPDDNVATLLEDVPAGAKVRLFGEAGTERNVIAKEAISSAHKMALVFIQNGASIMKYGYRIGHATRRISPGEWVHLHNCASDVDERSNTLDVQTGAPRDTREAYE